MGLRHDRGKWFAECCRSSAVDAQGDRRSTRALSLTESKRGGGILGKEGGYLHHQYRVCEWAVSGIHVVLERRPTLPLHLGASPFVSRRDGTTRGCTPGQGCSARIAAGRRAWRR